jgi:ribosome-associated toxin RatA of RatAB toxin-antitoxin module
MRTVQLLLHVPGCEPAAVYETLCDFESYPALSEAVQSVTVTAVADNMTISRWEVSFRAGLLRWVEEDTFDPDARSITFHQLEGDVALFDGSWQCDPVPDGTEISFAARIDMGIPSLADALEPIAARTLIDNTASIVRGLFGSATLASSAVQAPVTAGDRA